jgi:VWFA-related protein
MGYNHKKPMPFSGLEADQRTIPIHLKSGGAMSIEPKDLTRREILMGAASIIGSSLFARSQESGRTSVPSFSVNVAVVSVFVTVRDKKGNIVRDLEQEDFTLTEDGRPQTIQYFSRESNLPLTIGLVVDTTPSEERMLDEERAASRIFFDNIIRPGTDHAFLVSYSYEVELIQDLTSSRQKLEASLSRLQPHPMNSFGMAANSNWQETILANAVSLTSNKIMKPIQGRKAMIILGDGAHLGSQGKMAMVDALESDTMIYAVRIVDEGFGAFGGGVGMPGGFGGFGGGRDLNEEKRSLKKLTDATGGAFFDYSKKGSLDQIYAKIEEELRSQYSLGYTPDAGARDGYRTIKIGLEKKGLAVRGRQGYYPNKRK